MTYPRHALVTGANRGIGFALCRQLAAGGTTVWSACRPSADIEALSALEGDIRIVPYDARSIVAANDVVSAVAEGTDRLDWLINNAGVRRLEPQLCDVDADNALDTLMVNALAPLLLTRACLTLLSMSDAALVVNMSSTMGAVSLKAAEQHGDGVDDYIYPASKAALNMLGTQLARELSPRGITVINQEPGWVRTEMGGSGAQLDPADAAARMVPMLADVSPDQAGCFLDLDGKGLSYG